MKLYKKILVSSVVASCLFLHVSNSFGSEIDLSERDAVYSWIKNNVIGKTLEKPQTTRLIANDSIEATHSYNNTFANLVKTEHGLTYDEIWTVKQVNYDVDENGKRVGDAQNKDRAGVSRSELRVMKSTGELIGISRSISNSITDAAGYASRVRGSLKEDKLILNTHFVNYSDYFDKGGKYKAGGSVGEATYWVEGGKLHLKNSYEAYNLDPSTLEKIGVSSPKTERIIKEK